MGRPLVIVWRHGRKQLALRYRRDRDPHHRTQLQALMLLRQGKGLGEVAAIVGQSCRTLQRWISWYQQGGLVAVGKHSVGGGGGTPRRLSPRQEAALTAKAVAGEIRSVWDGVHWAAAQGVPYTYWGMRWVLARLGLKKKVPRPCNPKASRAQQRAWKKGA